MYYVVEGELSCIDWIVHFELLRLSLTELLGLIVTCAERNDDGGIIS